MGDLSGRVALVTGASRGIGRSAAVALAEAGCHVAVNYRERDDEARVTAQSVERLGRRAITVRADVADEVEVRLMTQTVASVLGSIDVLVNNAGRSRPLPLEAIGAAEFDEMIAVNLRS